FPAFLLSCFPAFLLSCFPAFPLSCFPAFPLSCCPAFPLSPCVTTTVRDMPRRCVDIASMRMQTFPDFT
ncbi:hypothetical protein, partial [Burkholderia sp. LK4]|uniref:hypothetical protein n=1 Tax=Burkholderia sp. LK4 TaxID=1628208 RepID=UPI001E56CEA4